jgi:hypothetical protein
MGSTRGRRLGLRASPLPSVVALARNRTGVRPPSPRAERFLAHPADVAWLTKLAPCWNRRRGVDRPMTGVSCMKRLSASLAAITVVVATAACTSAPASRGQSSGPSTTTASARAATALDLCRHVLVGRHVVSGSWTTVGDLRSYGYGPPPQHQPMRDGFGTASDTDSAVWCWTVEWPDSYTAWGVRPQGEAMRAVGVTGPAMGVPSGRPTIP